MKHREKKVENKVNRASVRGGQISNILIHVNWNLKMKEERRDRKYVCRNNS